MSVKKEALISRVKEIIANHTDESSLSKELYSFFKKHKTALQDNPMAKQLYLSVGRIKPKKNPALKK